MSKTVYIIVGPTAVGKTAFAIALAKHLNTEIISADARQCYKEMTIGVARPSPAELATLPHHFIASHSIHENVNAGIFEKYALEKVNTVLQKQESVVMVGGTGLYIRAFCEGIDEIPEIEATLRTKLNEEYLQKGLAWLQEQVQNEDPVFWLQAEQENPHRLLRALEVIRGTGYSLLSFQKKKKILRPFNSIKIGLDMPREILYERINLRVNQMVKDGLEKEVRNLYPHFSLNALQTVGYREWLPFFENKQTVDQVIDKIQQNTRQYAKRQLTWFRKDPEIQWYQAQGLNIDSVLTNNK